MIRSPCSASSQRLPPSGATDRSIVCRPRTSLRVLFPPLFPFLQCGFAPLSPKAKAILDMSGRVRQIAKPLKAVVGRLLSGHLNGEAQGNVAYLDGCVLTAADKQCPRGRIVRDQLLDCLRYRAPNSFAEFISASERTSGVFVLSPFARRAGRLFEVGGWRRRPRHNATLLFSCSASQEKLLWSPRWPSVPIAAGQMH